jgi:3-hydroxyisobutyrate dehydrogenase-like beta-hydroxyacid dehydrogenase
MPQRKDYDFSRLVGALCIRAHANVVKLGKKLGIDPAELFQVINGYVVPSKAVIAGLTRELDSDVRYLEKLVAEIKPG